MTISKHHLPFLYNLILLILLYFLITRCSGNESQQTIWEKAEKFVQYHSSEDYLKHKDSVFLTMQSEHTASEWVDYFLSLYSTRNWLSETDDYAGYTNEPLLPSGITLTPFRKNDNAVNPQLVVKADDSKSLIIIEGYEYPDKGIMFIREWKFPQLN